MTTKTFENFRNFVIFRITRFWFQCCVDNNEQFFYQSFDLFCWYRRFFVVLISEFLIIETRFSRFLSVEFANSCFVEKIVKFFRRDLVHSYFTFEACQCIFVFTHRCCQNQIWFKILSEIFNHCVLVFDFDVVQKIRLSRKILIYREWFVKTKY